MVNQMGVKKDRGADIHVMGDKKDLRALSFTSSLKVLCLVLVAVVVLRSPSPSSFALVGVSSDAAGSCDPNVVYRPAGLPPLKHRNDFGDLLEARKLTHGVEVGVQKGDHSNTILKRWKSCQSFALVDLWGHQENYKDGANVHQGAQDARYKITMSKLAPFSNITTFYRMLSIEAAKKIPDNSLDFAYLDARHDYCGVMEDLDAYYPKLRPGGILAGHDFLTAAENTKKQPKDDWSICADGSQYPGAVRGAIHEFAKKHGLVVSAMYSEANIQYIWVSWMTQKPTKPECVQEVDGAEWVPSTDAFT